MTFAEANEAIAPGEQEDASGCKHLDLDPEPSTLHPHKAETLLGGALGDLVSRL